MAITLFSPYQKTPRPGACLLPERSSAQWRASQSILSLNILPPFRHDMNTDRLADFIGFLDREIACAVVELNAISEKSRRHIQKLVYTNLVDRFDSTVDHSLLDNILEEPLLSDGVKSLDQPLAEGETLRFLAELADPKQRLTNRLETVSDSVDPPACQSPSSPASGMWEMMRSRDRVWTGRGSWIQPALRHSAGNS